MLLRRPSAPTFERTALVLIGKLGLRIKGDRFYFLSGAYAKDSILGGGIT